VSTFIQFAALGLGGGAVYVLLAQGMLLVYRGSGVLNLAHGAFAMLGAFLFYELHQLDGWSFAPAFLTVLAAGAGLGLATHFGLMRPLRHASSLSRVIATLGILLTLQAVGVLIWGPNPLILTSFLPQKVFDVHGTFVPEDRLLLLLIAVVATVVIWSMYRLTTVGLAMRGAAENPRGVAALGWSPDALAALNWGAGGALAAAAGTLIAPVSGLYVPTLVFLVIPALAVALIAKFESLPLVLLGGLAIGIAQSEMAFYVTQPGVSDSVPFVVIIVFLALRGKALPARGFVADRFAAVGSGIVRLPVVLPLAILFGGLLLFVFQPPLNNAVTTSIAFAIGLLSVVVVTGYAGQLSLAQFAFSGISALVAARLVAGAGAPFIVALLVGVLATIPAGIIIGLPALRTRGVSLAAVTLGLGVNVQEVLLNNPSWTGGPSGTPVGVTKLFGLSLDTAAHPNRYAFFAFACLFICLLAVASVRRGRMGRRLIAVKANERAAAALGVSVTEAKLYAFALAALIAGVAGIVIGFQGQTVLYDQFSPTNSIFAVAYAVIGGVGYLIGPLFGAGFAAGGFGNYLFNWALSGTVDKWVNLIGGLSLMLILVTQPRGMAAAHVEALHHLVARIRRRPAVRSAPPPAQEVVDAEPRSEAKVAPTTLSVQNLTVRFGGLTAVNDLTLDVATGEIVGLIGPNGAGKTTMIDAVTGFVRASSGRMTIGGREIHGWSAHRRARAGLSRSFQSLELFEDMTVRDNLRTASDSRDRLAYVSNLVASRNEALAPAAIAAIREFQLEPYLDMLPADLPYGRRRLVAVARAVATGPSILLLDEPAAGLDETETSELAALVRRLARAWGIGVLVIEHDMTFVMSTCDRIVVLDFGQEIGRGTPAEVATDQRVIAAYLGEEIDADVATAVADGLEAV
jgi:ABC-type branched-subunit amino acid transport system ATPase component/branched-subunit amino acid ABC-type transport system permease component